MEVSYTHMAFWLDVVVLFFKLDSGEVGKCMGKSVQEYSWIQNFEADFP